MAFVSAEKNIVFTIVRFILLPLSGLYYLIIILRNFMYDRAFLPEETLSGKVISVGNVTLGGTGKTPLVEYIAKVLKNKGWKIALLSRGYAREEPMPLTVVSNGENIRAKVNKAGDEPLLLAKNLRDVIVIVDKNRYEAGLLAEEKFGANLFILDDGFQHRKVTRDVNILAIDGNNPFGNGWIFPSGRLREPVRSIKRADVVVISEPLLDNNADVIRQVVQRYKPDLPIFRCHRYPLGFFLVNGDEPLVENFFSRKKIVSLSAIAQPTAFEKDLANMGFSLEKRFRFTDHHSYTQKEIHAIAASAREVKAEAIVTTQKDAMRLESLDKVEPPLVYLRIEMRLREEEDFQKFLLHSLAH